MHTFVNFTISIDFRYCFLLIWYFLLFAESSAASTNQVDLFGESLIGDLLDAPVSVDPVSSDASCLNKSPSDVDLFANATFVSAPPAAEPAANSQKQVKHFCF